MSNTKSKKIIKRTLITLIIAFLLFSVVSYVFVKANFDDVFSRTVLTDYTYELHYSDIESEYKRELMSFKSGENTLQGYLYGAENTKGLVVICHGLGGGAENYTAETIFFVDNGFQVFGYDNTGCYGSEGDNCIGLPQSVWDLDSALTFIENEPRFSGLPILLYGHSWGGYAVTAIFNFDHDITASVSVAGFNKPFQMIIEWARGMIGGFVEVERPYIWIYQKIIFGDKLDMTAVNGLNRVDTPVLIIHGSEDNTVGFHESGIINYRDEITNPNVQYKICDKDKQNGHSSLFASLNAMEYYEELDEKYSELEEEFGEDIPDEKLDEFYSQIDKRRSGELDGEFMQDVLEFYEGVLNESALAA